MNSVHSASGWWAYIYFILFYIAIDLILLDLMIAIAIEMYNAVRQQSETEEEEGLFGDLQGICFEVGSPLSISLYLYIVSVCILKSEKDKCYNYLITRCTRDRIIQKRSSLQAKASKGGVVE